MEDVIVRAALTSHSWRRRQQVRREIGVTAALLNLTLVAAMIPWGVRILHLRAPTTVLSYWHVAVAELVGTAKSLPERHRRFYRGLLVLYGTTAWYSRMPPMTLASAKAIVSDLSRPVWFRVMIDVSWHACGRIADLQYLTPSDAELDDHAQAVTMFFLFLKNCQDGALGSIKRLHVWNYELLRGYVRAQHSAVQLFPYSARDVNHQLALTGPHTSRDIRRGGAIVLTQSGARQEHIAEQLAHRSVRTQRTYTQMPNAHLLRSVQYMQAALSGSSAAPREPTRAFPHPMIMTSPSLPPPPPPTPLISASPPTRQRSPRPRVSIARTGPPPPALRTSPSRIPTFIFPRASTLPATPGASLAALANQGGLQLIAAARPSQPLLQYQARHSSSIPCPSASSTSRPSSGPHHAQ